MEGRFNQHVFATGFTLRSVSVYGPGVHPLRSASTQIPTFWHLPPRKTENANEPPIHLEPKSDLDEKRQSEDKDRQPNLRAFGSAGKMPPSFTIPSMRI